MLNQLKHKDKLRNQIKDIKSIEDCLDRIPSSEKNLKRISSRIR